MLSITVTDSRRISGTAEAVAAAVDRLIDRYQSQVDLAHRITGNPRMVRESPSETSRSMRVDVPGMISSTTTFRWEADGDATRLTVEARGDYRGLGAMVGKEALEHSMRGDARRVLDEVAAGVEPLGRTL